MMMKTIFLSLLLVSTVAFSATSRVTEKDLRDIYNNLNIATFPNSLGPQRVRPDQIYFHTLNLPKPKFSKNAFVIDDPIFFHSLTVLKKGDFNKDEIVDYEICFNSQAKQGTYYENTPWVISPLGVNGQFIALGFQKEKC